MDASGATGGFPKKYGYEQDFLSILLHGDIKYWKKKQSDLVLEKHKQNKNVSCRTMINSICV